jgi:hypothetical protein
MTELIGEPLTLALQGAIEPALARLRAGQGAQCLSDLTFANLYLFRAVHDYRYLPGAWPAISGRGYDGARYLIPLFDLAAMPWTVLLELLSLWRGHDHFYPLTRHQAGALQALAPRRFTITESRDDADYLYPAATFLNLAGRTLAYKRSQLHQFLAACTPSTRPFAPALEACAREILSGWMAQKGKPEGAEQADEAPCIEALAHAQALGLEGFVHFDRDRPIGFVLAQQLEPGVYALRFAKGLDDYVGLYPYLFQHFCAAFEAHFSRPVAWLNFEQDMGLPGLRRSKMSYRPAALLSKFRLAPVSR